jgi:density-regulated protein
LFAKPSLQCIHKIFLTSVCTTPSCCGGITGLDDFGVKLTEASKLFGKKFASGASITKNPLDKDQIEVQGDFLEKAAELILKQFKDKGIEKKDIYMIDNKKKVPFFDDEDGDDV